VVGERDNRSSEAARRLLSNLDSLDRSIARTSILLFVISIAYISLFYGASKAVTIPGVGIKLEAAYPYHVGAPAIMLLFQYAAITAVSLLRVEKELALHEGKAFDPRIPYFRVPTLMSVLFIAGSSITTRKRRFMFGLHAVVLSAGLYSLPLVACGHIVYWLSCNTRNWLSITIATTSSAICVIETLFAAIGGFRKLSDDTRQ